MPGPLRTIDRTELLARGVDDINFNFDTILTIAETVQASDNDSGLAAPVLMVQGTDNQHWIVPQAALNKTSVVLDHGLILHADQYTINDGIVALGYTPQQPYAISLAWSPTLAGISIPIALAQDNAGTRYWRLPDYASVNVLVHDHGRTLRRDEYSIEGTLVTLNYDPTQPFDIAGSWGLGGPGVTSPVSLVQDQADPTGKTFILPVDHGKTLLIFDHGLMLDAQDYTIDSDAGKIALTYIPAPTVDIASAWGITMDGQFMENVIATPSPDGAITAFLLPQDPVTNTLRMRARLANGTTIYYTKGTDFTQTGRRVVFSTVPPIGSTLFASMMTAVLNRDLVADTVDGFDAISAYADGVGTPAQGNKLVAVDGNGKLPSTIIPDTPSVGGFQSMSSTDPYAGTPAAANYLMATGPDGKFTNKVSPQDPELGIRDLSVVEIKGLEIDTNAADEAYTYNINGTLDKVEWLINGVVSRSVVWEYNTNGTIKKRIDHVDSEDGSRHIIKTVTRTYNYNNGGQITSVGTVVS